MRVELQEPICVDKGELALVDFKDRYEVAYDLGVLPEFSAWLTKMSGPPSVARDLDKVPMPEHVHTYRCPAVLCCAVGATAGA